MNLAVSDYLGSAQRAVPIGAYDPAPAISEFSQAATRLLEARYQGLRADDLEALLNNLNAFGYVFGLLEQTERFSLAHARPDLAGAFTEHALRVMLSEQEKVTALVTFADFHRDLPEFADGYCNGLRAAVKLARA